jgi:hypothetical protein
LDQNSSCDFLQKARRGNVRGNNLQTSSLGCRLQISWGIIQNHLGIRTGKNHSGALMVRSVWQPAMIMWAIKRL